MHFKQSLKFYLYQRSRLSFNISIVSAALTKRETWCPSKTSDSATSMLCSPEAITEGVQGTTHYTMDSKTRIAYALRYHNTIKTTLNLQEKNGNVRAPISKAARIIIRRKTQEWSEPAGLSSVDSHLQKIKMQRGYSRFSADVTQC